jgi:antitoxin CcdA
MSSIMLSPPPAIRRKPVNLSLREDLVAQAKRHTRNLSGTVETLLADYIAQAEARRRASDAELDAVLDALDAHHAAHGLLSDEFNDYR